jgi:hypothetical protein
MADFPETQDSDSDDVRWALETANTMWTQGDKQEALKWLRRAAESAEQSGDDMRSLMLAKARAELHSLVDIEPEPPTPKPPVDSLEQRGPLDAPPQSGRVPSSRPASSRPPGPLDSMEQTSRGPLPSPRHAQSRPPSRPAPPPARRSAPGPSPSSGRSVSGVPSSPISSSPSAASPSAPSPISQRFGDGEDARQTLVHPNRGPLPAPSATRGPIDERRAVRVAVQPVEGQPGVFLTRPLRPGERPAPGAAEAILVSVEGGVDPLGGR